MADRKVEFDVIAQDKASRKVDDVGEALERAKRKADDADSSFARLGSQVSLMARTMAKAGATVASAAASTGPLSAGLLAAGKAAAVMGRSMASLGTVAVAFGPSLVGGLNLVRGTFALMGRGFEQALDPVIRQFRNTDTEIGAVTATVQRLSTQGVAELADEFARVNLPAIEEGMAGIATNTNRVVLEVGRWINSTEGQDLLRTITWSTADAADQLAPKMSAAAIAVGRLANRAGDKAIVGLADVVGRILDRFTAWADSTSVEDINAALEDLSGWGTRIRDAFTFLRDVGRWMGENEAAVKRFSDAMALIGIALGLLGGNPFAVIIGGLVLLINHWDKVKAALSGAAGWWSRTWAAINNDPHVQSIKATIGQIADAVRNDLVAAWDLLRPALEAFGRGAEVAWAKLGPLVAQFFRDPNVVAGIRAIVLGLAAMVAAFAATSAGTAIAVAAILAALAGFIAWFVGTFVRGILGGLATLIQKFGEWLVSMGNAARAIPQLRSIGDAMVQAGQDAQDAAGKVRGLADAISGLKSKTVTVTVNNVVKTIRQEASGKVYITGGGRTQIAQARGGQVPGAQSRFDRVPMLLSGKEFVVNSRDTAKNLPLLERINAGGQPVAGAAPAAPAVVNVYVTAGAIGSEDHLARTVSEAVEKMLRQGRGSSLLARTRA